jgi:ABC-2 type transport system ATP-binding protein
MIQNGQLLGSTMTTVESSTPLAIEAENLSKVYRSGFFLQNQINSLQACCLTVPCGQTFGLLGPNGAGKTTLLKILLGIIPPTTGTGKILGLPLGDRHTKQKIGYLPENAYYYDYLTGWELLDFIGRLFAIPAEQRRQRIAELLDLVGLSQAIARKKQLRQYSKGMVQRIGLAQALINEPEVIFLDEPMSGLDPVGRYQVREIILNLKQQGKTVFFNSHILADAELICDRVGILNRGELIACGTLNELLGTDGGYQVQGTGGDNLDQWLHALEWQNIQGHNHWTGYLPNDYEEFLQHLQRTGGKLIELKRSRQSLEEFFIEQIRKPRNHQN